MEDKSTPLTPLSEDKQADIPVKPIKPLGSKNKLFLILVVVFIVLILLILGAVLIASGVLGRLLYSNGKSDNVSAVVPTATIIVWPSITITPTLAATQTPTPTLTPTLTPTPDVWAVTASVNTSNTSNCGATFVFNGTIHSPVAGDVQYIWDRSDLVLGIIKTIHFATPGTQNVEADSWTSSRSYNGYEKLRIVSPVSISSSNVNVSKTCDHTGLWYTNFGTVSIAQTGFNATMNVTDDLHGGTASIAGTFNGNVLTGSFSGQPVSLTYDDLIHTVNGTWSHGKWCGAISGSNFTAGCSFAGVWNEYVGGDFNASASCQPGVQTMNLVRRNNTVSGSYCNGTVSGTISYEWVTQMVYVIGTYDGSLGAHGPIAFYIRNNEAQPVFTGNYNNGVKEWCGWRAGSAMPISCLYAPM